MSDPELPWKLIAQDGRIYIDWEQEEDGCFYLGPKEQVMEAFSQFLAHEDYGETMQHKQIATDPMSETN